MSTVNVKYLKDESGNIISPVVSSDSVYNGTTKLTNDYIKSLSVSGMQLTTTKGNNTTSTLTLNFLSRLSLVSVVASSAINIPAGGEAVANFNISKSGYTFITIGGWNTTNGNAYPVTIAIAPGSTGTKRCYIS